jgi:hypothetical protein
MPKLELLRLGRTPCETPTGATVRGLITLASHCLHLSKLQIHFRGDSLVGAATSVPTASLPIDEPVVPREGCALRDLEVGQIPIPAKEAPRITHMLLRIFPRILNVEYTNPSWERVAKYITDFRRIDVFVRQQAGETHPVTY